MALERLQKLIAASGLCSRRHAETLLREGLVRVNGQVASLGAQADPSRDHIAVDGRPLATPPPRLTLLLNKPPGVLCTCDDPRGRPTVLDLLPAAWRQGQGLHPVGRLDAESRGALLISNDGALTLRLTHPRYGHRKTYRVWVEGHPTPDTLRRWRAGVPLDGVVSAPVMVRPVRQSHQATLLEVKMGEGRNRQIRRTAAWLGHPVRDLQRLAIGPLRLGALEEGHWRRVAPETLLPSPADPFDADPFPADPR
ncbi:MAG: pseudouridine synthase [Cyanobacteriota bacterium]|nr:pseudouridine synthase [Cyanobacteriota bacterium]